MPHRERKTIVDDSGTLKCHVCGRVLASVEDIEFYEKVGECMGCDDVRGDIADEATQQDIFWRERSEEDELYNQL